MRADWIRPDEPGALPFRTRLVFVVIAVFLLVHNLQAAAHCAPGLGCVSEYWAGTWEMSWQDGFLRRALRALELDYHYHSGSLTKFAKSLHQSVSFSFWPLLFLGVLARINGTVRPILTYLGLVALSAPLYVIAHDWSRFKIFTLYATLVLEMHRVDLVGAYLPGFRARIETWVRTIPVAFLALFPVLFVAQDTYRTSGSTWRTWR